MSEHYNLLTICLVFSLSWSVLVYVSLLSLSSKTFWIFQVSENETEGKTGGTHSLTIKCRTLPYQTKTHLIWSDSTTASAPCDQQWRGSPEARSGCWMQARSTPDSAPFTMKGHFRSPPSEPASLHVAMLSGEWLSPTKPRKLAQWGSKAMRNAQQNLWKSNLKTSWPVTATNHGTNVQGPRPHKHERKYVWIMKRALWHDWGLVKSRVCNSSNVDSVLQ